MEKYCIFCGEKLDENGVCKNSHEFKKMCLNCSFCSESENGLVCGNEENKQNALNKMLETIKKECGGYAVKSLEIEPVVLKKPTLKCGKWALSDAILREVVGLFK